MSYTPGPWNLYPNNASDWVVRKMFPDGQESHEIARCKSGIKNARLIAAAPDLLEALNDLLGWQTLAPDDVIAAARAAIAKAEGA